MKEVLSDEKKNSLVRHLGYYGPLLTETQREFTQLYVDDDLSLSEIAARYGVTRQSVCDTIRKAEKIMDQYESKLSLMARSMESVSLIEKAMEAADRMECTGTAEQDKAVILETLRQLLIKEETDYGV